MDAIYLDNAATSFPKPPQVAWEMARYLTQVGASVGRSGYAAAQDAGRKALSLRQRLSRLLDGPGPAHTVLTAGCTVALNMVLRGFLRPGDHCLVSAVEHNAVMRPLQDLCEGGVAFDRIPCDSAGRLDLSALPGLFRPNTRLVVLSHGSNVSGAVQDVAAAARLCRERGVPLCVDGAQTAGHLPIQFRAWGLSALAVPGHKGLLGPSGIGALLLDEGFARQLRPLITGGTGSASDEERQPDYMPDRLEAGTPNVPGIYGWEAALAFLEGVGVDAVRAHDLALGERFLAGLSAISGVRLAGPETMEGRVGVFSLDFPCRDNAEVTERLEREYGILARCGLHCAPAAHKALGTFPRGTVRLSFGYFNSEDDVDAALRAVQILSA